MENTLLHQNKLTKICSNIAVCLVGVIFAILTLASILQTCRIDQVNPYSEIINFDNDFVPLNLALIILSALGALYLIRKKVRVYRIDTKFIVGIMLVISTVLSLTWINLVQSIASGDAMILLNTARDAASGNYSSFYSSYDYYGNYSYYLYYPFQLGYVFFAEILYRIFGTGSSDLLLQIPNVIALDFIYAGLVALTGRLFNKTVTNMTAIALIACLQPIFMTTFTYGILIGLAFSLWSVYFTVRYIKENKLAYAGVAVLLMALSVVLKYNNMIMMTAVCIALILHVIDTRRFLALGAAALMVVCSVGAQKAVIHSYEVRSGTELNTQVSQTLYAYMGISESPMAPGWYNGISMMTLRDAGMDVDAADQVAKAGIQSRLDYLNDNGELLDFYKRKLLSQLNEPAFESIWLSQVRSHNIPEGETLSGIVTSVYSGGLAKLLDIWFNYYDMMIYIGFTAGMVWLIKRKAAQPATVILPVAVLGGILYHMIFEGKSQYLLPYFILLIPYAMYGLLYSVKALHKISGVLYKEQKTLY